jgi:hypothetical protein
VGGRKREEAMFDRKGYLDLNVIREREPALLRYIPWYIVYLI